MEKFKDMVDKGGDQDESARGELLAILQEYPRFGPANGEHQEAWRKRLDRLRNRLRKTAMPNNKTPYKPEVDLTDRVNTAIRREVDLLVTEIPYLGQYLRSVLKDGHSDWTYTGTEEWDTSPVAETVTKAQPSSG